jgi:molybdopterin-guanine dinucleotide biosynthesis protein A
MGRDKARLAVGTETLIEHALRVVARVTPDVRLACGPTPRYADLGAPLVCDRVPGSGPLAGIEAGLASAPRGHVIVLACDMPRVDEKLLMALWQYARKHALDVTALRSERGVEPLCAIWSTALLPAVTAALARAELSVRDLIATFPRVGVIDADGNASVRDAAINVNTPEDLEREREFAAHDPHRQSLLGRSTTGLRQSMLGQGPSMLGQGPSMLGQAGT